MLSSDYVVLFSLSLIIRYGVSLWPYSGQHSPPLHGDYEAQRHWQEVTTNLPLVDWYNQTKDNDLLYWGLDYPPLTAYHSWLVGRAGAQLNASYVALHTSRGIESQQHKLFMRLSVIVADLLVYFPAVRLFSGPSVGVSSLYLCLYPGLVLIDHGHFQYNSISLGLFIVAVALVTRSCDKLGSVMFCLALNYKQMELYHALPFFAYLLGKSLVAPNLCAKLSKLVGLGLTVLGTFYAVWLPFLQAGWETSLQVVRRIFPIGRGIFEDKVGNFWCSVDILLKLKNSMDVSQLGVICLVVTFLLSLPSNIHVLMKPTSRNFLFAQLNTSLVFFLFSFHVHEKTILLVAIPAILLVSSIPQQSLYARSLFSWFLFISTFSMVPLLAKDGLLIPTMSLSVFSLLLDWNVENLLPKPVALKSRITSPLPVEPDSIYVKGLQLVKLLSILGCGVLTGLHMLYPPPPRYPYLWPTVISLYSAAHFLFFAVCFHVMQLYVYSSDNIPPQLRVSKKDN